jgi:hypothetical protein
MACDEWCRQDNCILRVAVGGKSKDTDICYVDQATTEMTVDHTKRFQATTIGHYGTTSDKTIVKFDGFVNQVRFDALYTEAEYKLQVSEILWVIEKGVYLLVDGGYHKWRIMQCPLKHSVVEEETRWSEFAESVRKDVECSFGSTTDSFGSTTHHFAHSVAPLTELFVFISYSGIH